MNTFNCVARIGTRWEASNATGGEHLKIIGICYTVCVLYIYVIISIFLTKTFKTKPGCPIICSTWIHSGNQLYIVVFRHRSGVSAGEGSAAAPTLSPDCKALPVIPHLFILIHSLFPSACGSGLKSFFRLKELPSKCRHSWSLLLLQPVLSQKNGRIDGLCEELITAHVVIHCEMTTFSLWQEQRRMSVDVAAIAAFVATRFLFLFFFWICWYRNTDIFDGKLDQISLTRLQDISSRVYGDQIGNLMPKQDVFLNLTKCFFLPKPNHKVQSWEKKIIEP